MAFWDVKWSASGTAKVEADNEDEAREYVDEAVTGFDVSMLEQYEVHAVAIHDAQTGDEN